MYKNSILSDGLAPDYLQGINDFIQEWEGVKTTIEVFTSGSTGEPKRLLLEKEKVKISAKATGDFFGFKKGQSLLLNLSSGYIAGKLMIVRAIEHEMNLIIAPNLVNPLLDVSDKLKVDFGAFVPYQLKAILANPVTRKRYERITNVIIGGAPMSLELEKQVRELANNTFATFGMTESITHFALRNVSKDEAFYTCLKGFSVSQDERGCLILEPNAVIDDATVTNDLIELKYEQQFIWKGRADYVVNSGGVKLSPELIEQKVAHLFTDNRFYFIGRKSEQFGEELVLYIEGDGVDDNGLKAALKNVLSKYEMPKAICYRAKFKETHTGKVKRNLF